MFARFAIKLENPILAAQKFCTSSANKKPTVFDHILSGKIKAEIIYEDGHVLCFKDIAPEAPFHALLIPKNVDGLTQLANAEDRHQDILGRLLLTASKIAKEETLLKDGYRIVINNGADGGQTVDHLHLHLIGGAALGWPPFASHIRKQ